MINVFQIADNDQSIYYLGQIFGNVGVALSGTGPALLSQMFKVFNTIMLSIAVIVVTYASIVGVIKTAAEGETLGRNWSSVWIPLRTVLGVAALMPTTSGYCTAQVVIMWFIVQGIGAADMVWSTTVNYFYKGGGVMSAPPPDPSDITGKTQDIWTSIMQNLICQSVVTKFPDNESAVARTLKQPVDPSNGSVSYFFGNSTDPTDTIRMKECGTLFIPADGVTQYVIDYQGESQTVQAGQSATFTQGSPQVTVTPPQNTYPDGVTVKNLTGSVGRQEGLIKAYDTALPTLEIIADYYVKQTIDDPNCWSANNCDLATGAGCNYFDKWSGMSNPNDTCFFGPTAKNSNLGSIAWNAVLGMAGSNFLSDVSKLFSGEASNYAVNAAVENTSTVSGTNMSEGDSELQKAQVNGWVYAGAYYYYLSGKSNNAQDSYTDFVQSSTVNKLDPNGLDLKGLDATSPQMQIITNSQYLTAQAEAAWNATSSAGGGVLLSYGKGGGGPTKSLSDAASNIMKQWMKAIAPGDGSPVARIQSFGHNLLFAADILCVAFFGVSIGIGVLSTNFVALGFSVNPTAGAVLQGLSMLTTALFFLVAYMITIGGVMGVYVPLIPFILFSMGVIGWMIVVIEAVVAGPIIALGMLSPGGQHEIFSKAEASIMLTLNLMLRPTLMLFGLFAAMLLSGVAVNFINSAFYNVVASLNKGGHSGVFETFLYIVAYVGLIIVALNKCFELIHHVPDRVLHWIGHQGAGSSDQQALGEVKGKIGAGSEAGAGAGKGVGGVTAGQAQSLGKENESGSLSKGEKKDQFANQQAGIAKEKKGHQDDGRIAKSE
jgi:hypothetical protein